MSRRRAPSRWDGRPALAEILGRPHPGQLLADGSCTAGTGPQRMLGQEGRRGLRARLPSPPWFPKHRCGDRLVFRGELRGGRLCPTGTLMYWSAPIHPAGASRRLGLPRLEQFSTECPAQWNAWADGTEAAGRRSLMVPWQGSILCATRRRAGVSARGFRERKGSYECC